MRPPFVDLVARDPATDLVDAPPRDRSAERRAERYREWRHNRVVFMRPDADQVRRPPTAAGGDLPEQRKGDAL